MHNSFIISLNAAECFFLSQPFKKIIRPLVMVTAFLLCPPCVSGNFEVVYYINLLPLGNLENNIKKRSAEFVCYMESVTGIVWSG